MMKITLKKFGIALTVLYLLVIVTVFWEQFTSLRSLPANHLGDFLAGLFGPVAFLWLVLGFLQQGQELKQSRKALELQAIELRNSVQKQSDMVDMSRKQLAFNDAAEKRRLQEVDEKRP